MLKGNTLKNGQLNPKKDVQEDTSRTNDKKQRNNF